VFIRFIFFSQLLRSHLLSWSTSRYDKQSYNSKKYSE
jgi:hypothetical protein